MEATEAIKAINSTREKRSEGKMAYRVGIIKQKERERKPGMKGEETKMINKISLTMPK